MDELEKYNNYTIKHKEIMNYVDLKLNDINENLIKIKKTFKMN